MPRKSFGYLTVQGLGICVISALTKPQWQGLDNVPVQGGALIVSNHISHADPVTLGHALVSAGAVPRYLAKQELFEVPVIGRLLADAGQIPVRRKTGQAGAAYQAAVEAVRAGELVVMYPEGTVTRDPGGWPMRGKTGAARIALDTGCPVIPVGQWGVDQVWRPNAAMPSLRIGARRPVTLVVGPPVDLTEFQTVPVSSKVLRRATNRIMDDITAIVAELRGETPPATRWDPREHGQSETGSFTVH